MRKLKITLIAETDLTASQIKENFPIPLMLDLPSSETDSGWCELNIESIVVEGA